MNHTHSKDMVKRHIKTSLMLLLCPEHISKINSSKGLLFNTRDTSQDPIKVPLKCFATRRFHRSQQCLFK